MNQDLQDYIKKAREAGMNDGQIKQELLKVGWQEQDINQEFGGAFIPMPTPTSASKVEAFSETTTQKGKSKLFTIIMIIVIAAVLIGGGVLGYTYLIKPSAPKNVTSDQGTQKESNEIVDNQKNQVVDNGTIKPNNEVARPIIKDCGTAQFVKSRSVGTSTGTGISIDYDVSLPVPETINDKEALKCFMNAVGDCQKAKININQKGEDGSRGFEIKGKENQNCLIATTFVPDSKDNRTCYLSLKMISTIKEEISKSPDTSWDLMLPFGVALSMGDIPGAPEDPDINCK